MDNFMDDGYVEELYKGDNNLDTNHMDTYSKLEILTDEIKEGILDKLYPQYYLSKNELSSHYYNSEPFTKAILEQVVRGKVKEIMLGKIPQTYDDIDEYINSPRFENDYLKALNSGTYEWLELFKQLTSNIHLKLGEDISVPIFKMDMLIVLVIQESLYKDEKYTEEEIKNLYQYVKDRINPLVLRKVNKYDYINALTQYVYSIFGKYSKPIYNKEDIITDISLDIENNIRKMIDLEYEYIRPTSSLKPYLFHVIETVRDGLEKLHGGKLDTLTENEKLAQYVSDYRDILKNTLNDRRHEFKDSKIPKVEIYMDLAILGDYLMDMTNDEHFKIGMNVVKEYEEGKIDYQRNSDYIYDKYYKNYVNKLMQSLNTKYSSSIKLPQTEKLKKQEGDSVNQEELKAFAMAEYRHNAIRDLLYYKDYNKVYEIGYVKLYKQRKNEIRKFNINKVHYTKDTEQRIVRILNILKDSENKELLSKHGLINVDFNKDLLQVDMVFKVDNEKGRGTVTHSFSPSKVSISSNNKQLFEIDSISINRENVFNVNTLQSVLNSMYRKTLLSPQQYELYYETILRGYNLKFKLLKIGKK